MLPGTQTKITAHDSRHLIPEIQITTYNSSQNVLHGRPEHMIHDTCFTILVANQTIITACKATSGGITSLLWCHATECRAHVGSFILFFCCGFITSEIGPIRCRTSQLHAILCGRHMADKHFFKKDQSALPCEWQSAAYQMCSRWPFKLHLKLIYHLK